MENKQFLSKLISPLHCLHLPFPLEFNLPAIGHKFSAFDLIVT